MVVLCLGPPRLAPRTLQRYLLTSADWERWGTQLSLRPEVHTFTGLPQRNKAGKLDPSAQFPTYP